MRRHLLRGLSNGFVQVRTYRLRSCLTGLGVMLAVASFVVIFQMGKTGREGIGEVVERTQGKPGTYAIDVTGQPGHIHLTRWMNIARGSIDSDSPAITPFATISELGVTTKAVSQGARPTMISLVATDMGIANLVTRDLLVGQWWPDNNPTGPLSVVISYSLASELLRLENIALKELVGLAIHLEQSGFHVEILGVLPPTALDRYATSTSFGLMPMTQIERLPIEVLRPAPTTRMLVSDPDSGRSTALRAAERLRLASTINGAAPPDVQVARLDSADIFDRATRALDTLLGGIAAVALLVGALGITNINLVSLGTRVGEFGLRRAVGATPNDIFGMVLVEAAILGAAGGIAGVLLATVFTSTVGPALASSLGVPFQAVDPGVALLGLLTALSAGILAGVIPALTAKRLTVLDAVRST